ncbi:hypothetical protein LF1_10590 [Rubripirellula obstinata]|uniref:DUF1570 domain-containing protein n=1 Tax=Rubripirellula obstinata TaxID=406547 RepID=A0A5B1CFN8_9BACT|nr:DUF1570 domain-containing protein [Rubripirellula obstinata]KAA1258539.1 hypothetical protein LF1_10590 [Rubripirellula obstinata]
MPRLVIAFLRSGGLALCLGCFISIVCQAESLATGKTKQNPAVEEVTFRDGDVKPAKRRTVVGEVMIEAQDGGIMLLADDGHLWTLQPEQIQKRSPVDVPLKVASPAEVEARLLKELGAEFKNGGFAVHQTQHYLIAYNSSEEYAKRVGGLFESLYRAFFTYWKNQRWELSEPRFPMVAVVLKDHKAFLTYGRSEIGDAASNMIGYYNLASNRMATFNVPNWERNVSTIIHEATHQLAFNCGLQQRFADNPMWVSEGLATFFESPDMRNPGKWRGVGRVNRTNLGRWRRYQQNRPADSLATLLSADTRYRDPKTASNAYGEGWALTYFLLKTKRKEYIAYLRKLSEGKPLAVQSPRQRIKDFETAMGDELPVIEQKFSKFMMRVR